MKNPLLKKLSWLVLLIAAAACSSESDPVANGGVGSNTQPSGLSCNSNGNAVDGARWISAWGVTHVTGTAPVDTTVRNIARITASGNAIRIRFLNLSDQPMDIGAAAVGIREGATGANLKLNTSKAITFNCGQTSATIPPQTESFYSDPILFKVDNQDDLAISLHVKGANNPGEFGATWIESYKLPNGSGNQTLEDSGAGYGLIDESRASTIPGTPIVCNGCTVYALRDIEVLTKDAKGAMVFLGSSSFHGYNTSQNAFKRISDLLSVRMLNEITRGQRDTIVNRGIGGDTLQNASATRLERDVFDTKGVSSVVVWVTNDLSSRTADEVIANYQDVIAKAHAKGINVYCPTWIPGAQSSQANLNGERAKLNDWILNSGECDGVADYNGEVEAPGGLTFLPQYNSGDSIHSNDAGHELWAGVTPLNEWVSKGKP
ncbi:GDSL-type esterase/lipase family protein [Limnobacter sp.]|uniref:GDSL-type esterase/lipase family protein n=1 Tax=Limnobacter sp. TaxID=2003368 RepID=UPI002FE04608